MLVARLTFAGGVDVTVSTIVVVVIYIRHTLGDETGQNQQVLTYTRVRLHHSDCSNDLLCGSRSSLCSCDRIRRKTSIVSTRDNVVSVDVTVAMRASSVLLLPT